MGRIGRGARSVWLVGLAGLLLSVARAQSRAPPVELVWNVPALECPDARYVRGEVARLLGNGVATSGRQRIHAEAHVTHDASGTWRVNLVTSTSEDPRSSGARVIEAGSCKDVADATALVLALMIDPGAQDTGRIPDLPARAPIALASASAGASSPTVAIKEASGSSRATLRGAHPPSYARTTGGPKSASVSSASPQASRAGDGPHVTVSAAAVADWGSFPDVGWGMRGTLGLRGGRIRTEVAGTLLPAATYHPLASNPGSGGVFSLRSGAIRCGFAVLSPSPSPHVPAAIPIEVTPYVGAELAEISAGGIGLQTAGNHDSTLRWGGVVGGLLVWRFHPNVGLRLEIQGVVPSRRTEFLLQGQVAHREWLMVADLAFGLEFTTR